MRIFCLILFFLSARAIVDVVYFQNNLKVVGRLKVVTQIYEIML